MKPESHIHIRSESAGTVLCEPCTNGRHLRNRDISGSDQLGRMNLKAPLFNRSSPSCCQMGARLEQPRLMSLVLVSAEFSHLWSAIGAAFAQCMPPSMAATHKLQAGRAGKSLDYLDRLCPRLGKLMTTPQHDPISRQWTLTRYLRNMTTGTLKSSYIRVVRPVSQ